MSVADLASIGIKVESDLVWDRSNRHTVYVQDPSDEFIEQMGVEGTMSVSEVDEDTLKDVSDDEIVTATRADDTGAVVRDATRGQESENPDGAANVQVEGGTSPKGQTGKGSSTPSATS